jgi:putative transposase
MARLPRLIVPGLAHMVVHRGHNDQAVFLDDADRLAYLDVLRICASEAQVDLHAYGLLPAEVRLLATPTTERSLAAMMQAVGRRYVRAFNLRHGRRSSPWEGRFRSTVIEPGPDVVTAQLVVETLAVPGVGFAAGAELPPWTSLGHHLGHHRDLLITEHALYWALGNTPFERQVGYQHRLDLGVGPRDASRVMEAVVGGWALASSEFSRHLFEETGRRAQPLPRGRPPGSTRSSSVPN